jgi:AcrR family transcriptional regulator
MSATVNSRGLRSEGDTVERVQRQNKLGQGISPKGEATRLNLMTATLQLLTDQSPLALSVHSIAREAGTSPATFYVYFKSVREVILALVETLRAPYLRDVLPTVETAWHGGSEDHVRAFVLAYFTFWDQNRRLLAVRNLEADLGDEEFISYRVDMSLPVVDALADRILDTPSHQAMPRSQAWAEAVVCCAALEEMFSYAPEAYRAFNSPATPEDVVNAQISVICGLLGNG